MAIGDVKQGYANALAPNDYLEIQPPAGEEWIIHNIYYSNSVGFRIVYPGGTLPFDSDSGNGARLGMVFHVTNTQYLRITNQYSTGINVAFDGVQTK